jgi:hypothetical protein
MTSLNLHLSKKRSLELWRYRRLANRQARRSCSRPLRLSPTLDLGLVPVFRIVNKSRTRARAADSYRVNLGVAGHASTLAQARSAFNRGTQTSLDRRYRTDTATAGRRSPFRDVLLASTSVISRAFVFWQFHDRITQVLDWAFSLSVPHHPARDDAGVYRCSTRRIRRPFRLTCES